MHISRTIASRTLVTVICCFGLFFNTNAQSNHNDETHSLHSALSGCRAILNNGILILENSLIRRTYKWNEGNLISNSLTDILSHYSWSFDGKKADCYFPVNAEPKQGKLEVKEIGATPIAPAHLEANVYTTLGDFEIRRRFKIYQDCPAIACDYFLRGTYSPELVVTTNKGSLQGIENKTANSVTHTSLAFIERFSLPQKHLRIKAVQFFDATDYNNNLVYEVGQDPFWRESTLSGNLLFINNLFEDHTIFVLKEAPTSNAQLSSPGYDFSVKTSEILVAGVGAEATDINKSTWVRCYGVVIGISHGGERGALSALRTYQQNIRTHRSTRDDMIMMNTWGDRNQDKKIGEKFTMDELLAAKKLGITHFQIDDGWQTGRSKNSALAGGSFKNIWNNPRYWYPDILKFPNGLSPIVALGKKLGIEVCLWFNPSIENSFSYWEDDANALIRLYKDYGIRTFKIDGVQIPNKLADINFRKLLDTVTKATNYRAVFNLDVTAGRRTGYHYFNEYGNIFLENRYTDWGNYYPHTTLRNLWMLSKYVPPQNLQIEFLNNFRNKDKYPISDTLAPGKLPFEYTFAITMMAQPLAWMEATGLPKEAFAITPVVRKYHQIQADIHAGKILPIGTEPSGVSWTGFQSVQKNKGYILIFRELNDKKSTIIETWLPNGRRVRLNAVLGQGKSMDVVTGKNGRVTFTLPRANSYSLYRYTIVK
jgi:alpha-galactosidase